VVFVFLAFLGEAFFFSYLVALPINDISFEEQRPYPGSVQDNCKHVHHGQFHSPDTLEPARRTPDDPVDLLHPAVSSD
jgi:hypothetical protein